MQSGALPDFAEGKFGREPWHRACDAQSRMMTLIFIATAVVLLPGLAKWILRPFEDWLPAPVAAMVCTSSRRPMPDVLSPALGAMAITQVGEWVYLAKLNLPRHFHRLDAPGELFGSAFEIELALWLAVLGGIAGLGMSWFASGGGARCALRGCAVALICAGNDLLEHFRLHDGLAMGACSHAAAPRSLAVAALVVMVVAILASLDEGRISRSLTCTCVVAALFIQVNVSMTMYRAHRLPTYTRCSDAYCGYCNIL